MWEISEEGGRLTAVHTKAGTGTWLLAVGSILFALIWFAPASAVDALLLRNHVGEPVADAMTQQGVLSLLPLGLVGLGFLLSGVETRLVRDPGMNVLQYRYAYGFGTSERKIPLDQVVGLLVIKTYVEIYEKSEMGEVKVDDRIDGSLDLVIAGDVRVPLITDGMEDAIRAGAKRVVEAFGVQLLEHVDHKKEVRYTRRRNRGPW